MIGPPPIMASCGRFERTTSCSPAAHHLAPHCNPSFDAAGVTSPRSRSAIRPDLPARNDGAMTSRAAVIAIDALEPRLVADFWCEVLGWQVTDEDATLVSISPPDGSWPTIDVVKVPEKKTVKNRLHLDLRADGSTEVELERLLALGARRTDVGQGSDVTWVVLSDPEGNEFCLLRRTVHEARTSDR